jgi:hypothetical protein
MKTPPLWVTGKLAGSPAEGTNAAFRRTIATALRWLTRMGIAVNKAVLEIANRGLGEKDCRGEQNAQGAPRIPPCLVWPG